jgi:hypothetical protein
MAQQHQLELHTRAITIDAERSAPFAKDQSHTPLSGAEAKHAVFTIPLDDEHSIPHSSNSPLRGTPPLHIIHGGLQGTAIPYTACF